MSGSVYRTPEGAARVERQYRALLASWPVPSRQFTLPTAQGETFVIACGPEDAPPVVLLHGSQANSATWFGDVPLWAGKFRLYAIDMIGEAGLSAQVRPPLDSDAHALWLDDVFAGLGLTRAALVGMSLGGWLALDYAVRRPGKVAALALVCPAGIGRQKNFLLKAAPLLLLGPWGKRRMRELVFGPMRGEIPPDRRPLADLAALVARAIKPRVVKLPLLPDEDLRGLAMPLLAIMGGRDALIDMHDARARLERLKPDAEICFFEQGYHFLPGQTGRIMEFLERCCFSR